MLNEKDHGPVWVKRLMIQGQDSFHPRQEAGRYLGDTPAFDLPRLNLFFFKIKRTVSGAICSITPSCTRRQANNSSVQRARPSGAWLHANAVRCASCPSFTLAAAPSRAFSPNTFSRPPSQNTTRV